MQTLNLQDFIKKYNPETELFEILSQLPDIKEFGWLGGGALRRSICKQKLDSDFDFFFRTEDSYSKFFQMLKEKFEIKNLKQNEQNLSFDIPVKIEEVVCYIKIQLIIISYYNDVNELLSSFDYTLCQFATDGISLFSGDTALFDVANKKIVVNKITYPVSSLRRLIKYSKQGFYACGGALNDILEQSKNISNENKFVYID